ncbi:MAG: dihydrofolate reductase family protein [Dermatophilaceae bacterium]
MQILLDPRRSSASSDDPVDDDGLAALYAFPSGERWVRANMVTTLDGAVGGADGRSGSINTPPDNRLFAIQRELCDIVLVGAGTARAEGYRRVAPTPRAPDPAALAVVTRSAQVPDLLMEPAPSHGALLVVTCAAAGADRLAALRSALGEDAVVVCGDDDVDLAEAVVRLSALGGPGILCEGGPSLLGSAFAAGVVDELALTLAPTVVGGDAARMVSGTLAGAANGIRMTPHLLLEEESTLLGLWRVGADNSLPA